MVPMHLCKVSSKVWCFEQTDMRIDDIVNIIRSQATSSKALYHIWIGGKRLPRVNVFLNRLWVASNIPPDTQVEQDSCDLACLWISMLYQKCK